mgnify:CR=1 FL=1
MFYVIGSLLGGVYVYVYDSNDGSCELVLRKSLSGVDLAYKIMPSISLYKMCMLVGLPAFKCYVYTTLFFTHSFSLDLYFVRSEYVMDRAGKPEYMRLYQDWCCDLSYLVVLSTDSIPSDDVYDCLYVTLSDRFNVEISCCLLIPPIMAIYLLKLKSLRNADLICRAVDSFIGKYNKEYLNLNSFWKTGWKES